MLAPFEHPAFVFLAQMVNAMQTETDFKDGVDLLTLVHFPVEAPKATGGVKRSREDSDEESSAKRKRAAESSDSSSDSSDDSDDDSSDSSDSEAGAEVTKDAKADSSDDSSDSDSSSEGEEVAAKQATPKKAAAKADASSSSDSSSSDDGSSSDEEAPASGAGGSKPSAAATSSSDSGSSSDSDSSSDSESDDEEDKKPVAAAPVTPKPTPAVTPTSKGTRPKKGSNTPFKRVRDEDYEEFLNTNQELADNSYDTAFNASGYGKRASDVLLQVRGKDFRHGKTKMKRGNYRGGKIDSFAVNSIPL